MISAGHWTDVRTNALHSRFRCIIASHPGTALHGNGVQSPFWARLVKARDQHMTEVYSNSLRDAFDISGPEYLATPMAASTTCILVSVKCW